MKRPAQTGSVSLAIAQSTGTVPDGLDLAGLDGAVAHAGLAVMLAGLLNRSGCTIEFRPGNETAMGIGSRSGNDNAKRCNRRNCKDLHDLLPKENPQEDEQGIM